MNDSIKKMEEQLKQGRLVLFCGTPCEVMGIRARFKYKYSNLLLVDFLCHGVPSQKAYNKYIIDTERYFQSKIESISFRSKRLGWKTYCMYIKFANGKNYLKTGIMDPYLRMYFKNYSYRPSCYHCNRIATSEADITIGDYWGVTKKQAIRDTDDGISLAIVHNEIGKRYIDMIKSSFFIQPLEFDDYKYVYNYREYEVKELIDYESFDYFNNNLLKKPGFVSWIKSFLFSHKLTRFFIYRK